MEYSPILHSGRLTSDVVTKLLSLGEPLLFTCSTCRSSRWVLVHSALLFFALFLICIVNEKVGLKIVSQKTLKVHRYRIYSNKCRAVCFYWLL